MNIFTQYKTPSFPRFKTSALAFDIEKYLFYTLTLTIFLLGVLYAYYINQTVLAVVERKAIEERMATLDANLAEIEYTLMEKKNSLTLEYARSLGMTEVSGKKFVSKDTGTVLTLRD